MAKSRSIGGIYASLTLRDGGFRKGLAAANNQLMAFGKASAVGLAAGVAASTTALTAGTLKTLDQVDALGDLSAQTGVAIAAVMKHQRAYQDGGRAAEMYGKDIGKMQKSIVEAASGGADPFEAIGLNAEKLLKLDPASQFETIGDAIMRIENPAERTAKAMEIFGKGGMGLTTIFPGLKDAEKTLGAMPAVAQEFAGAMGQANDLIGHLPVKSDQFFTGFTAGIIGELLPNLRKIDDYDFTKVGQNLGKSLATGLRFIQDGQTWSGVADIAFASFIRLGEMIGHVFASVINAAADEFDNAFSPKGNKTLLAMKAVALDVITMGADSKTREAVKAQNRKEWEEANMVERPSFGDNLFKRLGQLPEAGESSKFFRQAGEQKMFEAWKRSSAIVADNLQTAADESIPEKSKEPPITGLAEAMKAAAAKPIDMRMEVNDYQRRGLSLGGGPVDMKQDEQITLLSSIDGSLKRMSRPGGKTF
ncbi:hypothetical protein JIN84_12985 [Luteolibacter yonseiensis]|uniref:Phage tail tape measure protein n=1 Tax=Luteolibacter yonseiensis TaxID=1144680 RepID=A0A934VCI8_9BACT|nr:hypothetical protein [Luteolibacter yonseiensis]MBK1816534.1 hypothetical protein [Luteolibacter yonseiensis]